MGCISKCALGTCLTERFHSLKSGTP